MNQLLSLYYYELKKNKTKFLIMTLFAILFFIISCFTIFFQNGYGMNVLEAKKVVEMSLRNTNITSNMSAEILENSIAGISFTEDFIFISAILKVIGAVLAVLMSFGVAIRSFKKKNKSYYIDSCLPVKIWKIKLSRILCGLSIYIYYLLSLSCALIIIDILQKILLGKYYTGAMGLFYPELVFIPTDPKIAVFITFMFVPVCIAGIQTIADIFFVQSSGKNIVKKIFSIAILVICGIGMLALIIYMQIYESFMLSTDLEVGNSLILNINPFYLGMFVFPIMFLILFIIDVKISKRKFRGGV